MNVLSYAHVRTLLQSYADITDHAECTRMQWTSRHHPYVRDWEILCSIGYYGTTEQASELKLNDWTELRHEPPLPLQESVEEACCKRLLLPCIFAVRIYVNTEHAAEYEYSWSWDFFTRPIGCSGSVVNCTRNVPLHLCIHSHTMLRRGRLLYCTSK